MFKKKAGIFAAVLFAATFGSHVPATPRELSAGDEVRCETKKGEKIQGTVVSWTDTSCTLELKHGGFLASHQYTSNVTFDKASLQSLERLEESRNYAVPGILFGIIAGIVVGSNFDNTYVPLPMIIGGAVGGLVGGAIGATIVSEKWMSVGLAMRRDADDGLEVMAITTVRLAR